MDSPPGLRPALLPVERVPAPDPDAAPEGFTVESEGVRIHFLDWGGPAGAPGVVLVPGLARSAWDWTPVARRLRAVLRVVALDLRGHGLSDAPQDGYDVDTLGADVVAVAEGSGVAGTGTIVLAGHGFGALPVAAAAAKGSLAVSGVVLVDGGWDRVADTTGQDVDEALRSLDEPPEVMRSMPALLADRRGWDPATWDADQERATRETVVETAAGRLVRAVRPHALDACVRTLYAWEPLARLAAPSPPLTVLAARDDDGGRRHAALARLGAARAAASQPAIRVARFRDDGHNLLRYRPAEVAAAILSATEDPT